MVNLYLYQENATVALHSIIGTEPWQVVTCGEGTSNPGDPLNHISNELKKFRVLSKYDRDQFLVTLKHHKLISFVY